MAYSKKERSEYNERRQRLAEKMGMDKNSYNALRRIGQSLHRSDEDSAMGSKEWRHNPKYWEKEYSDKEREKDVNEAFKKAGALRKKKKLDIHFYHQRDPRGATLHISKERMSDRDYSSKGHPVY